jgi:hypothetical protein
MDLSLAGVPLSSAQLIATAQAYSDAGLFGFSLGSMPVEETTDPATGLTPYYSKLLDRLSQSLTPAQIAVVNEEYVEQIQLNQYKLQTANHAP